MVCNTMAVCSHNESERKGPIRGSFIGSTSWVVSPLWRYQDQASDDGDFLTRKTNSVKKTKCRDRKEIPTHQGLKKIKIGVNLPKTAEGGKVKTRTESRNGDGMHGSKQARKKCPEEGKED